MKSRKFMFYSYNSFTAIEQKLGSLAQKGYILEKPGAFFWTFRKDKPQDIKYTISYFDEASIYNSSPTENQLNYYEIAEDAGWELVCEHDKMQIFKSASDNPIPFDTDEVEKLNNIHRCMKKSFLFSQFVLLITFLMNLLVRLPRFFSYPIDILSNDMDLISISMIILVLFFTVYMISDYYVWYYKSKKATYLGFKCLNPDSKIKRFLQIIYASLVTMIALFFFISGFTTLSFPIVLLTIAQIPIFIFGFTFSLKLFKKLKLSAKANKTLSFIVLFVLIMSYVYSLSMLILFVEPEPDKPYEIISVESPVYPTQEYIIYNDDIPLKIEDLFPEKDVTDYSYEKNVKNTLFIEVNEYSQYFPDSYPRLHYTVYIPKFDFIYDIAKNDLLQLEDYLHKELVPLDDSLFGTEAYTFIYTSPDETYGEETGEYLIFLEDKIIYYSYQNSIFTELEAQIILDKLA